jgi:hypothetical protein
MAKKSKGFGELLRLQRTEQMETESLKMFSEQIQKGGLGQKQVKTFIRPKGQAKMSDALEEFVEPYLESAETYQATQNLYGMAVFAWNLALVSEEERQSTLDDFIKRDALGKSKRDQQDAIEILTEMMERKLRFFGENRNFIVDYQLRMIGNQYHLSVASMEKPAG